MMDVFLSIPLAILSLALAAVALWRVIVLRRRLEALAAAVEESRQQLRGLAVGAAGQGRHLARARQDLERLRSRLERLASGNGANPAVDQAIRMARKGLVAREIMETCGLSQMEAELVVLVHQGEDDP